MKIIARVYGAAALRKKLDKVKEEIKNQTTLEQMLEDAVEKMKVIAPELTGALRDSIRLVNQGKGKFAIVVSDEKASYHEYSRRFRFPGTVNRPYHYKSGSGKPAQRPFIRPVLWETMRKYPSTMKKALFEMFK